MSTEIRDAKTYREWIREVVEKVEDAKILRVVYIILQGTFQEQEKNTK